MEELKITPSPWKVERSVPDWNMPFMFFVTAEGRDQSDPIVYLYGGINSPLRTDARDAKRNAVASADADLIAAAPDMYSALDPGSLEAIADEIECFANSGRCHSLRVIAKAQRAALLKASGK